MINQGKDTSMGSRTMQKIDQKVLDQMVLSSYSNMVLIKVPNFREERKTKAGIILDVNPHVQYLDGEGSHMADMERVVGIVEKIPSTLRPDGDMLAWETPIELRIGDTVYFDYMDSINSTSFVCEDDEYRLIPYSSCYMAIRGEEMICLSGYCLFESIYEKKHSLSTSETLVELKGKVYQVGTPVTYSNPTYTDDIDIKPGDVVTFRRGFSRVYLERQKHLQTLDLKLFRAQRAQIIFNHGQS